MNLTGNGKQHEQVYLFKSAHMKGTNEMEQLPQRNRGIKGGFILFGFLLKSIEINICFQATGKNTPDMRNSRRGYPKK